MRFKISRFAVLGVAMTMLAIVAVSGTAAAAQGGKSTTTSASCAVTPNPVTVGTQYTFLGTGFKAWALLNVQVRDAHGTLSINIQADATGAATATAYAYWAGTSNVSVYDTGGRKPALVATCSFQVQ